MRLFLTVSIIIAFVHSILFSISLVIENSRSAVSEEQPKLETAYLLLFLRVWTSLRFLFGILIVFYSNSQIKSCLYTFLYKNHGSIWFYMCSTVQSLQTVLNGVINLLSIKNSRNILISVNYTINLYIFITNLVDNYIIFPYRIFIIFPKAGWIWMN